MQTLSEIKALLAQHGLTPRKRFGQNFLHDQNQLRRLVDAAAITPGDVVLEVGPGTGTLTEALMDAGATVVACEIDRDLAGMLQARLGGLFTLVGGDVLDRGRALSRDVLAALTASDSHEFKLVANLPYQIASPLVATILLQHGPGVATSRPAGPTVCTGLFITIQREVADRLLAPAGGRQYGPLSVIVQTFATVERIALLSPSCFWPAPEVTSAMVAIKPIDRSDMTIANRESFGSFVTQVFTRRRKQLGAILGRDRPADFWPPGVAPVQRPETLSPDQFLTLWHRTRQP